MGAQPRFVQAARGSAPPPAFESFPRAERGGGGKCSLWPGCSRGASGARSGAARCVQTFPGAGAGTEQKAPVGKGCAPRGLLAL